MKTYPYQCRYCGAGVTRKNLMCTSCEKKLYLIRKLQAMVQNAYDDANSKFTPCYYCEFNRKAEDKQICLRCPAKRRIERWRYDA